MSLSLGHKSGGRYTLTFPGKGLKDEGLKHLPRGLHQEDNLTFKGDKNKCIFSTGPTVLRTRTLGQHKPHSPQYQKDTQRTYFLYLKSPKTRAHTQRRTHGPQSKKDTRYPSRTSIQDLAKNKCIFSPGPMVHRTRALGQHKPHSLQVGGG